MEIVLILIYEVWAVYSGYQVMSGRSEWLEEAKPLNRIIKFSICWFVGNLVGAFYLFVAIVKLIIRWHAQ